MHMDLPKYLTKYTKKSVQHNLLKKERDLSNIHVLFQTQDLLHTFLILQHQRYTYTTYEPEIQT
jgi:hypothetical protein